MKLTARASYAVRLMLELHRLGGEYQPVRLGEIAEVTGISRKFLEQLVVSLKSHDLLRSKCGRKGGYSLARPAEKITVGHVLTAVAGRISLAVCVDDPQVCMYSDVCSCRLLWSLMQRRMDKILNEFSIADLTTTDWMDRVRDELAELDVCSANDTRSTPGGCGFVPACARTKEQAEDAS